MSKGITKKEMDVLLLIAPPPIGVGHTQEEAANYLGITERALNYRLERFKKRCPDGYERFCSLCDAGSHINRSLKHPKVFEDWMSGSIKEIF